MRVNLFANNVSRYQVNGIAKQKQSTPIAYQSTKFDYLTTPNFTGFFKIVKTPSEKVIEKFKKIVKPDCVITESMNKRSLETIKKNIDDEIAPFVNKLIDRIKTESEDSFHVEMNLGRVANLTEKYKKCKEYPKAMELMQKAFDEKIGDEPRFELSDLNTYIFGEKYDGSEAKNNVIEMMLNAKDFYDNPRFDAYAFHSALDYSSKSDLLEFLLKQTIKTPDTKNSKKLAQIIQETEPDKVAQKLHEATVPGKEEYLIDEKGMNINGMMKNCTPEKLPILKTILPKVSSIREVSLILNAYTPERHSFFEKGLKLVDKKVISMKDFAKAFGGYTEDENANLSPILKTLIDQKKFMDNVFKK